MTWARYCYVIAAILLALAIFIGDQIIKEQRTAHQEERPFGIYDYAADAAVEAELYLYSDESACIKLRRLSDNRVRLERCIRP